MSTAEITFNGAARPGDPRFYHADVSRLRQLGLVPTVTLADGLKAYAEWFKSIMVKVVSLGPSI